MRFASATSNVICSCDFSLAIRTVVLYKIIVEMCRNYQTGDRSPGQTKVSMALLASLPSYIRDLICTSTAMYVSADSSFILFVHSMDDH